MGVLAQVKLHKKTFFNIYAFFKKKNERKRDNTGINDLVDFLISNDITCLGKENAHYLKAVTYTWPFLVHTFL